jgi:hypothetical protein
MNKRMFVAAVGLTALLSTASPVFAQAIHEFYGPAMPMEFGSEGERHWMEYGYSGPWIPPLVWEKGLAKVGHNHHARGPSGLNYAAQPHGILVRNKHAAARSKDAE